MDGVESYTCLCAEGFTGAHCSSRVPVCPEGGPNPCQNGGECVDKGTGSHYECVCKEGFRGRNCQVNVDDCENNLCQVNLIEKVN